MIINSFEKNESKSHIIRLHLLEKYQRKRVYSA